MTPREQAAEKYWQDMIEGNPNGFTVAPYVNRDCIPTTFEAGAEYEAQRAAKLVEALKEVMRVTGTSTTQYHVARAALAAYEKGEI